MSSLWLAGQTETWDIKTWKRCCNDTIQYVVHADFCVTQLGARGTGHYGASVQHWWGNLQDASDAWRTELECQFALGPVGTRRDVARDD